jgi:branched-chain amino acid transport system substrate-binding protein
MKNIVRAFCFVLILPFLFTQRLFAADEIKIGVMLHLGGDFAAWGQAYLEGITIAQEELNASGGVGGKRVSLIVEDIRFDSRLTAAASKKLLEVDKVPVALISTFTEVMVAGPMFERAKIPLVVIGDSDEEIDKMGEYIFSTGSWVKGYAVSASQFMRERLELSNVAVLATQNPWSKATASTFEEDFKKRGGQIAYQGDMNPQDSDFRTLLLKLKTRSVDGIFAPLTAHSIPFFKQARELDMPIITAGGALDNDVIATAPAMVEGRYVTDAFLDVNRPEAQKLINLYQRKYNKLPSYPSVTARGYDGFLAISQALQKTSKREAAEIKNALSTVDFEGAGFHLRMSPDGGARLPISVLQVKNGHLEKQ